MFICQQTGGICVRRVNPLDSRSFSVTPAQLLPPLSVPVVLSAPVGEGNQAKNFFQDVTSIQRALNLLTPGDGGAAPLLEVDSICGPKTKGAIQAFQVKHFGWKGADKLIEPGKQTLAKLNALLATVVQRPLTMEELIRAWGLPVALVMGDIQRSFLQARSWILAARAAVLSPRSGLLDKHFLRQQQPNPAETTRYVSLILDRMQQVFQRSGGLWGADAFQPEPILAASDNRAWTTAGGFFKMGQSARAKHGGTGQTVVIRFDTIYVTPIFPVLPPMEKSYTIVHELAHFVSQTPEITDRGYYHRGTAQGLQAKLRLENADTFAMLAFEAGTGSSTSPLA